MADTQRKVWLVCYDICDPKRLRKVYRTMRGFGDHLQYSVFRCELSPRQYQEMLGALDALLKPSEDQVLLVPLGSPTSRTASGMQTLGLPLIHAERVCRIV